MTTKLQLVVVVVVVVVVKYHFFTCKDSVCEICNTVTQCLINGGPMVDH